MAGPLRPMNLGEILDRTFELYRKRFLLFVGIAALPAIAMLGLQSADRAWVHTDRLLGPLNRGEIIIWSQVVWFGYAHISTFLAILFLPAFVRAISNILFGEKATTLGSLRFAGERWPRYLWIAFLKLLAQFLLPEALMAGLVIGSALVLDKLGLLEPRDFMPIGAAVLIPLAGFVFLNLWVASATSFSIPTAALEGLSGIKAMHRSWLLTRGSRWRILLTWAAITAGVWAMAGVDVLLLQFIWYILHTEWHLRWFNEFVFLQLAYISYTGIAALTGSLYPISITLLYFDQRVRKEGYDLEKMMEDAGLTVAAADVPMRDEEEPATVPQSDAEPGLNRIGAQNSTLG